ncbi:lipocalin family protein [Chryseobacterium capnotolerans]|uniref:lipocalin family protein n=1 Tax=Chryseobacterium TaxID=59732 RepID=UPI00083A688F|nr:MULTISPECIES: lipocalin family protein [Chryseobacterium]UHO36805.1 lipocalin family protein [Chryseobacterium capnotolerans]
MKKLLFWAISALLILYSCSKDDDQQPTIIGTWKTTKKIIISGKDGSIILSELYDACEGQSNLVFTKDQKVTNNEYKLIGGNCSLLSSRTIMYTYDDASKKLTFTYDSSPPQSFTLNLLTHNEFQVIRSLFDYDNDGIDDKNILVLTR